MAEQVTEVPQSKEVPQTREVPQSQADTHPLTERVGLKAPVAEPPRKTALWVALGIVVVAAAGVAFYWWYTQRGGGLPPYIVQSNGRLEFARTDIAVKYAGRIVELSVHEGDNPTQGQILARQDDSEVKADIAGAEAKRAQAAGAIARAQADLQAHRSSEALARLEKTQADELFGKKLISDVELQRRQLALSSETAQVVAAAAALEEARTELSQADALIAHLNVVLGETIVRAPVAGRIEYKVIENGAVLQAGGRVATLLDPTDVYMTVFLGMDAAGKLKIGDEARIVLDAFRGRAPIPAFVSFVSPEAQFTPKYVETQTERDKLMYRIKLQIPAPVALEYDGLLKAGQTGYGYVRLDPNAPWPASLLLETDRDHHERGR